MPGIGTSLAPYHALVEGSTITGEIVDFRVQQKSDYDSNRPLYFVRGADGKGGKGFEPFDADGKPNEPICDWVFTLDVGVEDENGETERRVFLDPRKGAKGTAVEGKRGRDAVEIALKKAKAHRVGLEIGGTISITRGPKLAPKKGDAQCVTYTAEYTAPEGGVGSGTLVDEVPHMIGGGRFDPNERGDAPVATPAYNLRPVGQPNGTTVSSGGSYTISPMVAGLIGAEVGLAAAEVAQAVEDTPPF
jgi:hypothetical protein